MQKSKNLRYTVIKGEYWIHYTDIPRQGPQPDGDTITFHPDDITLVRKLPWFSGRPSQHQQAREHSRPV